MKALTVWIVQDLKAKNRTFRDLTVAERGMVISDPDAPTDLLSDLYSVSCNSEEALSYALNPVTPVDILFDLYPNSSAITNFALTLRMAETNEVMRVEEVLAIKAKHPAYTYYGTMLDVARRCVVMRF